MMKVTILRREKELDYRRWKNLEKVKMKQLFGDAILLNDLDFLYDAIISKLLMTQ